MSLYFDDDTNYWVHVYTYVCKILGAGSGEHPVWKVLVQLYWS